MGLATIYRSINSLIKNSSYLHRTNRPFEIHKVFFDDIFIKYIVKQSNIDIIDDKDKIKKDEIKKFLAIILFMSILSPVSQELLWYDADEFVETKNSFVTNLMSYSRFKFIKMHFRLTDHEISETDVKDGERAHAKSKKAIDLINKMIKQPYSPTQKIDIDESMIKFRGRCSIKNYQPNKPIKIGLKVYVAADSNAYVFALKLYDGMKSTLLETIKKLCSDIKGKNHVLYTDNFYTSLTTAQELKKDGIYMVGTLKSNRCWPNKPKGFAKMVSSKHVKRELIPFCTVDNINMCLFYDRKIFGFLNTHHNIDLSLQLPIEDLVNGIKYKKYQMQNVPEYIKDYNLHMNGVDRFDQYCKNYDFDCKSNRWTFKISMFLIRVLIHDSFILFIHFKQ